MLCECQSSRFVRVGSFIRLRAGRGVSGGPRRHVRGGSLCAGCGSHGWSCQALGSEGSMSTRFSHEAVTGAIRSCASTRPSFSSSTRCFQRSLAGCVGNDCLSQTLAHELVGCAVARTARSRRYAALWIKYPRYRYRYKYSIRKVIPKSTRTRASGNNDSQGEQPKGLAAASGGERCGWRDSARAMSVGARAKGRQPPDAAVRATPSVVVSSRSRVVFRKTGCNCGCRRHKSVSQRELLLKRQ